MTHNYVAKNIDYLCQKYGISPRQLALDINMAPSTLYRLIDPENERPPRLRTVKNIANYFKLDPALLSSTDLNAFLGRLPITKGGNDNNPRNTEPEEPAKEASTVEATAEETAEPPLQQMTKAVLPHGEPHPNVIVPLVEITNPSRFCPEDYFMFIEDYGKDEETQKLFGFRIKEWIPIPYGIPDKNTTAYVVQGDSMWPMIENGDIAFITEFDEVLFDSKTPDVKSGDIVVAKGIIDGAPAILLRKAIKNEVGDIFLVATNPNMPNETVKAEAVYGKVVGITRPL